MSQGERHAPNLDSLRRFVAATVLDMARREHDLGSEGGFYDPVVWRARIRYLSPFGLRVDAEQTLCGVLRARDTETGEILVQSKPFDFTEIDTDAPMVEEAMKAWGAKRERERRHPFFMGGDAQ